MVRGRTTGRGARRGAAAAGQRAPIEAAEASGTEATPTPAPAPRDNASSARSTPAASVRSGTATRATIATRAPPTGRFRPKAVRRDEAERDSLARQEEEKARERAAEERRARGRSRFRSKRSRGDTMGRRGGSGRIATGPFSSGTAGKTSFFRGFRGHFLTHNSFFEQIRWLARQWRRWRRRRRWLWDWIILKIFQVRIKEPCRLCRGG